MTTVELDHETRGPTAGVPVLIVSGLGAQRVWWPDHLLDALAQDRPVIAADNRDVGASPWLDHLGGSMQQVGAFMSGEDRTTPPPYTLADMAADQVALLDRLGVERVHVVGASMGGMIAQHLAFSHPDRVASLTAIMTSPNTGPRPTPEAAAVMVEQVPTDSEEAYVAASMPGSRVIGSPPPHFDEEGTRQRHVRSYRRGLNPGGTVRQFLALLHDGDRRDRLPGVSAPTLVLHGTADPLIPVAGGRSLAAAVPGARLVEVNGMGHDLPRSLHDPVVGPVREHLDRVEVG